MFLWALCDPMDCSTPGLPVHHQLPEFFQTHVHWTSDAIQSQLLTSLNIQNWFPLGWTGWISLQWKEVQGVRFISWVRRHDSPEATIRSWKRLLHGPVHLCKGFGRTGWGEADSSAASQFPLQKVKGIFQRRGWNRGGFADDLELYK